MKEIFGQSRGLFWLRAAVILGGAIIAWDARYEMNPDGISYLDLSDAVVGGEPQQLVNAYWSPLYPLLLGVGRVLIRPSATQLFQWAHALNFLIYILTWFALERLIRLSSAWRAEDEAPPAPGSYLFPAAIFLWVTWRYIGFAVVTPDLLLLLWVVLGLAEAGRLLSSPSPAGAYRRFSLFLGLAALTKAVVFPVALIALAISILAVVRRQLRAAVFCQGVMIFLLLGGSWIAVLSWQKGRLTTGEVSRLAYAWYVNDIPLYMHWQGAEPGSGHPLHAPRRIFDMPPTYYFGDVFEATFPLWFDPSYWHEGLRIRITPQRWLTVIVTATMEFFRFGLDACGAAVLIVILAGWRDRRVRTGAAGWLLLAPFAAALVLFCLIHVEDRLIAPFLFGVWMVLLLMTGSSARSATPVVRAAGIVLLAALLVGPPAESVRQIVFKDLRGQGVRSESSAIAAAVTDWGLRRGERMAVVGSPLTEYWVKLIEGRVVAQIMLPPETFCRQPAALIEGLTMKLESLGVQTVIMRSAAPCAVPARIVHRHEGLNLQVFRF